MSNVAINIAAEFKGKPAFDKAAKSTANLEKSVKKLGRTLGVSLSSALVVNFGKRAAQAFMQDEKEATRLALAVKNLGLEFANPTISAYIDKLAAASGVADGMLRPAFQSLLTTTGSLTKSQELLAQAIDISAGSGIDLNTVAQDLANGYIGVTRGLRKYNLGLSQTQLKTMSFEQIQAKLNAQFSGANAAYLETYAGKMSLLGVAAGEAQEQIGRAVIDLAMAFTGSSDIDNFVTKIEKATNRIVAIIDRITLGIQIIRAWLSGKTWSDSAKKAGDAWLEGWNAKMRRDYMKAWEGVDIPLTASQSAAAKAAEALALKRARELKKEEEKRTKELKKQSALKRAGTIFDLDQIQIIAALKKNVSADERRRLELQLALATENFTEVQKLTKELAISQGLGQELATFLASLPSAKNPFEAWKGFLDGIETQAARIAGMKFSMPDMSSLYGTPVPNFTPYLTAPLPAAGSPGVAGPTIVINNAGSVVSAQSLIDDIRGGLNVAALSGSSANVERRIGGW